MWSVFCQFSKTLLKDVYVNSFASVKISAGSASHTFLVDEVGFDLLCIREGVGLPVLPVLSALPLVVVLVFPVIWFVRQTDTPHGGVFKAVRTLHMTHYGIYDLLFFHDYSPCLPNYWLYGFFITPLGRDIAA